ncbi:MAG: glycosyl hydrolase family protein, partial [Alphaproteobacteria bacterium]
EYKSLLAFRASKELRKYHELESYVLSAEYADKKKELLALRFKQTEDYQKEREYNSLRRQNDIKTYYSIKDSEQLKSYLEIEKSDDLKKFNTLDKFVNSDEFIAAKKEASLPARQKFEKSDLAKTLSQYEQQRKSEKIRGYFKFIKDSAFKDFISVQESGLNDTIAGLEKEVQSKAFLERKLSMKKAEYKNSAEKRKLVELKKLKKSGRYKRYLKHVNAPNRKYYDMLHNSPEIEAYSDLTGFVTSESFKNQRKEIESKTFKDTKEYQKLLEYISLKKSERIRVYFKFGESKEFKTYLGLKGSSRIKDFENLKTYIESDEFQKFKTYCLKNPKKRWLESKEYESLQEYEALKRSEKFAWYLKNIDSKKFDWHRVWNESFIEDFSAPKIDSKKWITRYYWGDKILKDGYSLAQDKHFITDGKNLHFENGKLHIVTRKEVIQGKSWHASKGFISREFGYTSGLINTGASFRQKYGTFEAKMKFHESKDILNAFWLVGMTQVPHIDIAKAGKKLSMGNIWGDARNLKSIQRYNTSLRRDRFAKDYHIFSVEWIPEKITWKINGVEVASSRKG